MNNVIPSVLFTYNFHVLIIVPHVQCGFLMGDDVQNLCQLIAISDIVAHKPLFLLH